MIGIDQKTLRITWTVFLFLLFLLLIFFLRAELLVFAVSIFFAYVLWPVVAIVERMLPKRRVIALTIVYLSLIGGMVGIGFAVVPRLYEEATGLITRFPGSVSTGWLAKLPLPAWAEPARYEIMEALRHQATGFGEQVLPVLRAASGRILSGVGSLAAVILVPIVAFFFLKDAHGILSATLATLGLRRRRTAEAILSEIHRTLQSYIRALVLLAAASFVAWAIFLNVLGEPYALLLAALAGVLELLPVVGPASSLAVILIVTAVTGSGGLLWILLFWALYRIFQDYVLNPFLMSSEVEVHPLMVIFGVLAGARIGGVPGMFFSVPVIAIVKVIITHLRNASTERQFAGDRD